VRPIVTSLLAAPRVTRACLLVAALAAARAVPAAAQRGGGPGFLFQPPTVSFSVRTGYDRALAGSDLFDFVTRNLTLSRSSFSAHEIAGDMAIWLTPRADLVLGVGYTATSHQSEFRDWVDTNNKPIVQRTSFTRLPLTASYRLYLRPRGVMLGQYAWLPARFAPYIGAGAGLVHYKFRQSGDFIDFTTLKVFSDAYNSSGSAWAVHALAGMDVAFSSHGALTAEARYTSARASLDPDFTNFRRIDLSGLSLTAGISMRY
jgi:hypothetical protein